MALPSVTGLVPDSIKERVRPHEEVDNEKKNVPSPNWEYLQDLMNRTYNVKNLVDTTPEEFEKKINEFQALNDAAMEGYESGEGQRGKTVQFYWPYDHDFGTFKVGP